MQGVDDQTVKAGDREGTVKENSSKKTIMARPTVQELSSQFMTEAEREAEEDRFIRKSKQSPFIPIGELIV